MLVIIHNSDEENKQPYSSVSVAELRIKKSLFRSEVFYADTARKAKELVKQKKTQYRDARHVVHAFVIGNSGETLGCSDDGEPDGTAGQPALAVLKGSGITNIAVTVTRWFGGILLGTGGLVRAYSAAVKEALACVPTEPLIKRIGFVCECRYEDHQPLLRALSPLPIRFNRPEFTQHVLLTGDVPLEYCTDVLRLVTECTKGVSTVQFEERICSIV